MNNLRPFFSTGAIAATAAVVGIVATTPAPTVALNLIKDLDSQIGLSKYGAICNLEMGENLCCQTNLPCCGEFNSLMSKK